MSPYHPGEVLLYDFMHPLNIQYNELGKACGISEKYLRKLCAGDESLTKDAVHKLATFFNTTQDFWLGLQVMYDKETGYAECK